VRENSPTHTGKLNNYFALICGPYGPDSSTLQHRTTNMCKAHVTRNSICAATWEINAQRAINNNAF